MPFIFRIRFVVIQDCGTKTDYDEAYTTFFIILCTAHIIIVSRPLKRLHI
jgi:hypothetical protein